MAERFLATRFNVGGAPLVDHRTWALASDGDLMEGVASEAASLAGHLRLGKLTVIYDEVDLAALERGLPDCTGVALGFDRLAMLAAGSTTIEEVLAFPAK